MGEIVFDRGGVCVDESFARFGSKTYAIGKITSTDVRVEKRRGSRTWIAWWILAALLGLGALGATFAPPKPEDSGSAVFWFMTAVFGLLGYVSWRRRQDSFDYQLLLATSAGEVQAFKTTDQNLIGDLRVAIEHSMAAK